MAKLTEKQIKEQSDKIQAAIDRHKRENKEEHFTSLNPEEVVAKLKRVNSPLITSQGWGGSTPGGTFTYSVGIHNPDPVSVGSLYVHVWVGSGNVDPVVGTFLNNVDSRFPRLSQPPAFGVTLAPGANMTLRFSIAVPAGIQKTVYLGNSCLMQLSYHDVGRYLDRGSFPFNIT